MIRVDRGAEPPELAAARRSRLAAAVSLVNSSGIPSRELSEALTGYKLQVVKRTLFANQHKKCAWCERRRDYSSSPIDHYRPKDGAWRNHPAERPRRTSPGHYWWLAWTWENLLFACARCNDQGHKANYFPLAAGSAEAPSPVPPLAEGFVALFDVTTERPMLLDPAVDCFLDHIRWVAANETLARRLWTWTPRALTERGQSTIDILKLTELADELQQHLVDHVLRGLEEVEQHLKGRRTKQAAESWTRLLMMLEPDRAFTAASWCALTRWVDESWRTEHRLAPIPRPL
jgi:uncharacterized protein (TIGR02646 family)